jgi:cytidylate kinase
MMPVLAMTREMGSGGREVAQRIADKLRLTLVLHHLVEHDLAEHLQARESAVRHLLEGGATLRERLQIGNKRLARYATEEILDLANRGNVVIRGWGACVVLREVPHVLRVRVCAPMEVRERAVMERSDIKDRSAARREIERNDAAHRRTLQNAYGVDREDSMLYDLVLNTERNSIETCARLVCDLAESPEFRETEASRAILNDKALEAHVRIKLRERFGVGTGVSGVEAKADGGKIVLTGMAVHRVLVEDASKLASEVSGVKEVQNRMVVVHGPRAFT